MTDGLRVVIEEGVQTIVLDRPETLNALTPGMVAGLVSAFRDASARADVRVVLVRGAGRAFCAGADLTASDAAFGGTPTMTPTDVDELTESIVSCEVPVIAAVHGPAAGFGLTIAAAADLVVASAESYFLMAFTRVGLMPEGGVGLLATASIGRAKAMRMALLAERLPAREAEQRGLVSHVVEAAEFDVTVAAIVESIRTGPAAALGASKRAINDATLGGLADAFAFEVATIPLLLVNDEFRERVQAFLSKD